jgi:hypothetical protein
MRRVDGDTGCGEGHDKARSQVVTKQAHNRRFMSQIGMKRVIKSASGSSAAIE